MFRIPLVLRTLSVTLSLFLVETSSGSSQFFAGILVSLLLEGKGILVLGEESSSFGSSSS